ncbi:MAG: hypothetical protein JXL97_18180 [Bacteroidales bacterium]|nr:hypothetical protein [Bacteroidales bacterium]
MKKIPKMIMIGSNARNSGKTWLCTYLIHKFSLNYNVIGIKAKTLYSEKDMPHFNNEIIEKQGFDIFEEHEVSDKNDTSKMRLAGAKKALFLQTKIEKIQEAVAKLTEYFDDNSLIICESNNLIGEISPSLFLLCTSNNPINVKSNYQELEKKADLILKSDGEKFDFDIDRISFNEENQKWEL